MAMINATVVLFRFGQGSRSNVCVIPTLQEALDIAAALNVLAEDAPKAWTKAYDLRSSNRSGGDRAMRSHHQEVYDATMAKWHKLITDQVGDFLNPEDLCNPYCTVSFGVEQLRTLGK
jgi:hypothetical protein